MQPFPEPSLLIRLIRKALPIVLAILGILIPIYCFTWLVG